MTTSLVQSGAPPNPEGFSGPLLDRLIAILEEMIVIHQRLLPVLQQEKFLVLEGDPRDLMDCVKDKEGVLEELDRLELGRQSVLVELKLELLGDEGPWTINQLIQSVDEPYRLALKSCGERLQVLASSTRELNEINSVLIERSLQKTANFLSLLSRISNTTSIYLGNGQLSSMSSHGRVIDKG